VTYLLVKGLHVIGFVSWFSGLLYVVRLFIYHVEASLRPEPERTILSRQFEVMERRLWYAITVPGMVLTLAAGSTLAYYFVRASDGFSTLPWLHAKLALVAGVVAYHFRCGGIRKQLAAGNFHWSSSQLRLWNELATLLLVAIVMVAVFKSLFHALWGTLALMVFAAALGMGVQLYRRHRRRSSTYLRT
jgi:putative membrane protein